MLCADTTACPTVLFTNITACCLQLSLDLKELESPEELYPLKDALERAKQRVAQSTGIREALEAEVRLLNRLQHSRMQHSSKGCSVTSVG